MSRILELFDVLQMETLPSLVKRNMKAGFYNKKASFGGADSDAESFLTNQGGIVLNNPQLFNIFLGNWSSVDDQKRIDRLNKFTVDILSHQWMTVLRQYGIEQPGKFVGSITIDNSDMELTDAEVQTTLQKAIDTAKIAEPSANNVYIIYLSDNTSVRDTKLNISMCNPSNDNAFGYHSHFKTKKSGSFYYAVIPDLNDDCIKSTCVGSSSCSLSLSQTREERQTQIASHEIAETVTNPEATTWYDKKTGKENADICNGLINRITVGENTWCVQRMYSQADAMAGREKCVGFSEAQYIKKESLSIVSNKYNLIGGGIGLTFMLLFSAYKRKDVVSIVGYTAFGFIAGVALTQLIKKEIPLEQKTFIKLHIDKLGQLIP